MPHTADRDDINVAWTVQSGQPPKKVDELDGQFFHTSQLPDPKVQAELGPNYRELWEGVNGNLPVTDDEEEAIAHPRGPERAELEAAKDRKASVADKDAKPARARKAKNDEDPDSGVPAQN